MSRELGLKTLNLEPTSRIAHTEYISHVALLEKMTGMKYDYKDPVKILPKFYEVTDFDYRSHGTMPDLDGPLTTMGQAVWEGDEVRSHEVYCPFENVDAVLNFDPVAAYGVPDIEDQAKKYKELYATWRKEYPETIIPGGLYRSMVSFCIDAFGWDMFLMALATDTKKFAKVMEGMAEIIMAHTKAWAKIDLDCFLTHDDIVWSSGPFTQPAWYREYVFPYFKEYWKVVHDAGIKVLYIADGNFDIFVDDIAEAGADGFVMEPLTNMEKICEKYGKTHVIVGNADSRIASFGTIDEIKKEIDRCVAAGRNCPGYIFAWGNQLPDNIPMENIEFAFEYFEKVRNR